MTAVEKNMAFSGEGDGDLLVHVCERASLLPAGCMGLFARAEADSFDLSADWFGLMESSGLPEGARPVFYLLDRNGEIRALLPLFVQRDGQVLGMTSFYTSLYRPILADGVTADELAPLIHRVFKDTKVDRFRFDAMDPESPAYAILEQALRSCGLLTFRFFGFGNHYLPVAGRAFSDYMGERPSKVRNTIQRRLKKFMADGRGRLDIFIQGAIDYDEAVRIWETIYSASWKVPEPYPDFIPGLIRFCMMRGWLRLGVAYYDGRPVAAQIWIVGYGRAAIYKLAYDEAFAELSAGTLLTSHLIRYVMEVDKVAEIDYLVGDDAYKKEWMSHRRERWGIVAFNPWSINGMLNAVAQFLGMLRRGIAAVLGPTLKNDN